VEWRKERTNSRERAEVAGSRVLWHGRDDEVSKKKKKKKKKKKPRRARAI